MSEEFLKNAISCVYKTTPESILNMTKTFNLRDFYGKNFKGMAEIMITPHQVVIIYGDSIILHNQAIHFIADNIIDFKIKNPIIGIRCRSEENMKAFYPELLRNGFFVTKDMITILETLYNQLYKICNNSFDIMGPTLQEFKDKEWATIVEKVSDIPNGGNDKNIIGITIREYIKLNKEQNNDFER